MSLYENIHKRRKSGKKMRKKGDPGAPSDQDFKNAAKTSKENMKKKRMRKKKKGTSRKKLMIPNY